MRGIRKILEDYLVNGDLNFECTDTGVVMGSADINVLMCEIEQESETIYGPNARLIQTILTQLGIKEVVGEADNPEVLKYFDYLGFDGAKLKDETAWCAAAANWCLGKSGFEFSGKLNARSLLNCGDETETPVMGDMVVLWREDPSSWKGHVGFFHHENKGWIWMWGGNQNNTFKLSAYPKKRVLKYLRPRRAVI